MVDFVFGVLGEKNYNGGTDVNQSIWYIDLYCVLCNFDVQEIDGSFSYVNYKLYRFMCKLYRFVE